MQQLNQLIRGWINYFKIGSMKLLCERLDSNIRFRLRMCIWKHWKTPQNRAKNLIKLGITEHSAVMEDGRRVWKEYETLFVDGEDFEQIGEAFERERKVVKTTLGGATLRLMRQRELVDFATGWIEHNRK